MISRIWHGWTHPHNADAYERLLRSEIFTGIAKRSRGERLKGGTLGFEVLILRFEISGSGSEVPLGG
jgi:hypothetical protein